MPIEEEEISFLLPKQLPPAGYGIHDTRRRKLLYEVELKVTITGQTEFQMGQWRPYLKVSLVSTGVPPLRSLQYTEG